MIVNPDTNELIFWLKHHEAGILEQNDVTDLDAELTTVTNPLTDCEEPALNLKVEGNPDSPLIQNKIDQFNTSLEKMGPFQVFDTTTKTFIFYSELKDGECVDRIKIIDKETGKVYDEAITSITQTPDGNIIVKTADGQTMNSSFQLMMECLSLNTMENQRF